MTEPRCVLLISHVDPGNPSTGNELRIRKMISWLKKRGYRVIFLLNADTLPEPSRTRLGGLLDSLFVLGELSLPRSETERGGISLRVRGLFERLGDRVISGIAGILNRSGSAAADAPGNAEAGGPRTLFSLLKTLAAAYAPYGLISAAVKRHLCPRKLVDATRMLCARYRPHAVIAEYIFTARCLDAAGQDSLKIIDTIDMFSRKQEEVMKHGIRDLLHCTRDEERSYLLKAGCIVAIQEHEAELFRMLVPERQVVTVGIDFDFEGDADAPEPENDAGRVLVIGSSNNMNVHGLTEFIAHAWPKVRRVHPSAILRVVGTLSARIDTRDPSIEKAGWVEDPGSEYRKASIVINPIIAGTGLKIKSVEALCNGKALITTPNGAEGLASGEMDPPFIVCETWDRFAEEVADLLSSPERRGKLERAARRFARGRFRTEVVYRQLEPFFPVRSSHDSEQNA